LAETGTISPDDEAARQAEALRGTGDVAAARRVAREALARSKDDLGRGKLLAVLARADLDSGEAAAAARSLEEAAKLVASLPVLQAEIELDLGRARRRQGDLDGALRSLAHAAERFRSSGRHEGERRALAQRGKVLYAKNDLKGARAAFRAALDLEGKEPEDWRLHHALARAYEKEGRKGEADRSYRLARDAGWDGRSKDLPELGGSAAHLSDLAALSEAAKGGDAGAASRQAPREKLSDAHDLHGKASGSSIEKIEMQATEKQAAEKVAKAFASPPTDPGPAHADEDADALARAVEGLQREDLVRLVSLSGALSSAISPGALLDLLLDRAIAWTGAQRGYVVLSKQGEGLRLEVHAARAAGGLSVAEPEDEVSRNIVREAVEKGVPVVSDDAARDQRLLGFSSVMEKALRSIACFPLRLRRTVLGAFYLERRDRPGSFGSRERALLEALATHAAIALDRSQRTEKLEESFKETKRALDERTGAAFGIIGRARLMRNVFRVVEKMRGYDAPVLIEGDTGTGKELVARAIHASSKRADGPFVVESAGSLSEGLLEAELFGHEKGAFTGATEARRGAFERATGGTLFLDEVSDMPVRMQALLLRALESKEVRPIGAPAPRKFDCRIIAASRVDLRSLIQKGEFREDLYFRLNVLKIHVPSLKDRKEDVPALAEAFLRELGRPSSALAARALEALLAHDWPGNVRELKHTIERASLLAGDGTIEARHLGLEEELPPLGQLVPGGPGMLAPVAAAGPASAGKVAFRGHVLNRRQLALIDYLRANGLATNREYVELVKVSIPTGWRDLKDLLDKGVIRAEGQGRNTVYRLEAGVKDELGTSTTD
jgi:transcriptional regulator with GAF, ATPase, and Fis domain